MAYALRTRPQSTQQASLAPELVSYGHNTHTTMKAMHIQPACAHTRGECTRALTSHYEPWGMDMDMEILANTDTRRSPNGTEIHSV